MDKIIINGIELTQEEFDLYKKGGTIADIIETRKQVELTEQELKELKFKQDIEKVRDSVADKGLTSRISFDNASRGWTYRKGGTELYLEITEVKFVNDDYPEYVTLYINQDNNIYKEETFYDIYELVDFLNECVEYVRKLEDAKDSCPF